MDDGEGRKRIAASVIVCVALGAIAFVVVVSIYIALEAAFGGTVEFLIEHPP